MHPALKGFKITYTHKTLQCKRIWKRILCNNLKGKRILKRIDIWLCVTESLCCTPETNTLLISSVQSLSRVRDPMDHSMPGFPVYDQLPEPAQTHVHWVGDAIQPSHPLSSPSPPAINLSQHQDWQVWSPCNPRDSQVFSPTPQFKSINSLALSFLYSPIRTSIHDYWKNHSFN